MIWMIFMKGLKNEIQIRNTKYWLHWMIWLLTCLGIKKLNPEVTDIFMRAKNVNISLVFIMQSHFSVTKDVRLNCTHYFIVEVLTKCELKTNCI